jgi:hypothetical protein
LSGGSEKAVAVTRERQLEETMRLVDLADDRLGDAVSGASVRVVIGTV